MNPALSPFRRPAYTLSYSDIMFPRCGWARLYARARTVSARSRVCVVEKSASWPQARFQIIHRPDKTLVATRNSHLKTFTNQSTIKRRARWKLPLITPKRWEIFYSVPKRFPQRVFYFLPWQDPFQSVRKNTVNKTKNKKTHTKIKQTKTKQKTQKTSRPLRPCSSFFNFFATSILWPDVRLVLPLSPPFFFSFWPFPGRPALGKVPRCRGLASTT